MFGSKKAKEPAGSNVPAPVQPKNGGAAPAAAAPRHGSPGAAGGGNSQGQGGAPEKVSAEEAQRRAAVAIRQSLAFAQIISLLMRSPHYKHYTLVDLEWLVLPPLLTGQFSVAEASAKEGGPRFPIAVALWAGVSAEVDKRLSENLTAPIRLRPDEWNSGDVLWLVDAIGDARVVSPFLKQLSNTIFKGREVKVRSRGADGGAQLTVLSKLAAVEGQASAPSS